jgi:hypothetical protein
MTAPTSTSNVLRRIQRLAWFGLTACAVIVGTSAACGLTPLLQVETDLALVIILASTWAIMSQVGRYVRTEEERISEHEDFARRETARAVARVAKDRVKNKLSLIAGYSEFVANDSRLPDDLREAAQKAVDGAFAVARAVDDLDESVPLGRVNLP